MAALSGLKLVYFDLRARGEPIRLALAAGGVQWEDVRIPMDKWKEEKKKTPFGQLPYIEYKGKHYSQSVAIVNFVGKELGLHGKTNLESLRVDETIGLSTDLLNAIFRAKFDSNREKKDEAYKKLSEEEIPKYLSFLQRLLKENGDNGFFVSNSLTVADLFVYSVLDSVLVEFPDAEESFPPEVKKLRTNVEANPRVKSYLASRKSVPF